MHAYLHALERHRCLLRLHARCSDRLEHPNLYHPHQRHHAHVDLLLTSQALPIRHVHGHQPEVSPLSLPASLHSGPLRASANISPPLSTTANATRSLANYQAMAMNAPANLAPGMGATDGTAGSTTASSTGGSGSYGSGSASMTTSAGTTKQTSGATTAFKAPAALSLAGLLAVGVALFL